MNANPNYSIMGDINLDGAVSGSVVNGVPSGDIASFVAGWGDVDESGTGTVTSWKNGDLNRDGKTDVADFLLLRQSLGPAGAGSWTLESLLGVAHRSRAGERCLAADGLRASGVSGRRRRH